MNETLRQRIRAPGPKRILSLDGGGIRGLISLGYLQRVEDLLKANVDRLHLYARPASVAQFRLRDYYDLIGGTSTGAIIASALAIGMTVPEVTEMYLSLAKKIFARPTWLGGATQGGLVRKFSAKPLQKILESVLGQRMVSDDGITTGLCIIAKRFDTNSTWVVTNAPENIFYSDVNEPNAAFRLSQVVRASTAAPSYFDPEVISLGKRQYGFIDGGISPHNNPALQLFMAATLPNFGFSWPTGVDRLSILSLGTGDWSRSIPLKRWKGGPMPFTQVIGIVDMFMEDCSAVNETVLQAIGAGYNRRNLDLLTGSLTGHEWGQPLLRYERFQVCLDEKFFAANGLSKYMHRVKDYRKMDSVRHMHDLVDIGKILAERDLHDHVIP